MVGNDLTHLSETPIVCYIDEVVMSPPLPTHFLSKAELQTPGISYRKIKHTLIVNMWVITVFYANKYQQYSFNGDILDSGNVFVQNGRPMF